MKTFDNYEIHPCNEYIEIKCVNGLNKTIGIVEQCDEDEAQFYTLYGHIDGEGLEAIGDFKTMEHAKEIYYKITGQKYE